MDFVNTLLHTTTLVMIGYLYFKLYKAKNILNIVKYKLSTMNIDVDDILDDLISEPQIESK